MKHRDDLIGCVIGAGLAGIVFGYYFGWANTETNPPPMSGAAQAEPIPHLRPQSPGESRERPNDRRKQRLDRAFCHAVEESRRQSLADDAVDVSVFPGMFAELLPHDGNRRFIFSCGVEYRRTDPAANGDRVGAFAILQQNGDGWDVETFEQMCPQE